MKDILTLVLFADAKASTGRFGICAADGTPLWHGRFFDNDSHFTGEQSTGELSAAMKAIWLANMVQRHFMDRHQIHLALTVDATWLCTLSGKAAQLQRHADKCGIVLTMRRVTSKRNLAEPLTTCSGYLQWDEKFAAKFVVPTTLDEWKAENQEWEQSYDDERNIIRRKPAPIVTPEIAAQRKTEGELAEIIGRLSRLHIAPGVPKPGAVSQGRFKKALRAAHDEGMELNESLAAKIFAELSR